MELASSFGVDVILLESGPLTAARGRQAGLEKLNNQNPGIKYIQFIDGDCLLDSNWLESSIGYMEENLRVAAVCGRRREEFLDRNIYSRLVDIDWEMLAGEVLYVGGDSLIRLAAIQEVEAAILEAIPAGPLNSLARIQKQAQEHRRSTKVTDAVKPQRTRQS